MRDSQLTTAQLVEQKWREFRINYGVMNRLMHSVRDILSIERDKNVAERTVAEKYIPLLEEAMDKTREALEEWQLVLKAKLQESQESTSPKDSG